MSRALLLLALAVAGACGPKYHTAARYRFDHERAAALDAKALACCAGIFPERRPPRPFMTDGCSMWPDGVWQRCCVEHDVRYWCGGSRAMRGDADGRLRRCVADEAGGFGRVMGWGMQVGVWLGGSPLWPAYWRWGYGWPWSGRYRTPPHEPIPGEAYCDDLRPMLGGAAW